MNKTIEIDTFYKTFPQYRTLEKELKKVVGENTFLLFQELSAVKKIKILDELAHHLGL